MSRMCATYTNNEIGLVNGLGLLLYDLPKGVPWKFWLDPRFPQDPKLKWILKWLSLDKGYLKFCFLQKGESFLLTSCHVHLSARSLVMFQIIIALSCILFVMNCPVFRYYLINNHSKRGDVETLARSSVSPPPQVKMTFKLTASR